MKSPARVMMRLLATCASTLLLLSGSTARSAGAATGPTVWVPDYYGQQVQMRMGEGPTMKSFSLRLPSCNPNSVAVNTGKLYVVCNGALHGDKVLVYNASIKDTYPSGAVLTPEAVPVTQTITSPEFNDLIGIAVDADSNIWLASNGANEIL